MHTILQKGPFGAYAGPQRLTAAWFGEISLEAARRALRTLLTWQERDRQRHALAQLDARMLKDIGLSRAEVALELHKPFWHA
jgi:uncharacterized protein YjiS (DUF1127 family)